MTTFKSQQSFPGGRGSSKPSKAEPAGRSSEFCCLGVLSFSPTGDAGYINLVGANQIVIVTQPLGTGPRFYRLKVRVQ